MTSTYNDIRAAIEGRITYNLIPTSLITQNGDTIISQDGDTIILQALSEPSYPIAYENVPFTPPNNLPWIQVKLTFGDNNYGTLLAPSTGFNRQNGLVTIGIFTPVGVGAAANYTIAERIKDLFDRQTISSIIFDAASGPNVITPSEPESAYFQTELIVTFTGYVD